MPDKQYPVYCLRTNVRILFEQIRNRIKTKVFECTRISDHEAVSKLPAIYSDRKENEQESELNPFQEDCQRTDFLIRLVEKIKLDIFDHLL
jgi:hypothetical protein